MNTNDQTQAMMPPMNPANQPQKPVSKKAKPQNDHMAAKVAAGVVGGMALAGAGAGVVYAMDHFNNDEADASNPGDLHVDHADGHGSHDHVHVNNFNTYVQQPSRPIPQDVGEGGDVDVHFVGLNVTDIDEDGNYEISGTMTLNGQEMLVIDVDVDGTFDLAVADFNSNGVLEEDEVINISNEGLKVENFYAGLAAENPEQANEFMAQLNAVANGDEPTLVSYDEDGTAMVGDDDDVMVNVLDSGDDIDDVDDGMVAVVSTDSTDDIIVDSGDIQVDVEVSTDEQYAAVEHVEHVDATPEPEPAPAPEPEQVSYHDDIYASHDDVAPAHDDAPVDMGADFA